MNVYGAEKMARYFGKILLAFPGIEDRRNDPWLSAIWQEKCAEYGQEKAQQEAEFAEFGHLKRFYQE